MTRLLSLFFSLLFFRRCTGVLTYVKIYSNILIMFLSPSIPLIRKGPSCSGRIDINDCDRIIELISAQRVGYQSKKVNRVSANKQEMYISCHLPAPTLAPAASAAPASYAARTRAQNALSAYTRKPVRASSVAVRSAAVCAASVRAARANPGEWFCAPSGDGIAIFACIIPLLKKSRR